eukprot:31235-Pelagococcus_subviridis.AAC.10
MRRNGINCAGWGRDPRRSRAPRRRRCFRSHIMRAVSPKNSAKLADVCTNWSAMNCKLTSPAPACSACRRFFCISSHSPALTFAHRVPSFFARHFGTSGYALDSTSFSAAARAAFTASRADSPIVRASSARAPFRTKSTRVIRAPKKLASTATARDVASRIFSPQPATVHTITLRAIPRSRRRLRRRRLLLLLLLLPALPHDLPRRRVAVRHHGPVAVKPQRQRLPPHPDPAREPPLPRVLGAEAVHVVHVRVRHDVRVVRHLPQRLPRRGRELLLLDRDRRVFRAVG